MDRILVFGRCRLKIICTRKIFTNPCWGEAGYHDHGVVEAQASSSLRVDSVDAVKKRGVQDHQGEDDVRPIEGSRIVISSFRNGFGRFNRIFLLLLLCRDDFLGRVSFLCVGVWSLLTIYSINMIRIYMVNIYI